MTRQTLPIEFGTDTSSTALTAHSGLLLPLQFIQLAGLLDAVERYVPDDAAQGWTASEVVQAVLLLNIAGGESLSDVEQLQGDPGLARAIDEVSGRGLSRRRRRLALAALRKRWRRRRTRSVPSVSVLSRWFRRQHDEEQERLRAAAALAFIPEPSPTVRGLERVNAALLAFLDEHRPQSSATLDMDATLITTQKREALYAYTKEKAYQPHTVYWAEQDTVVLSEYRDGNVPAGHQQLRVLEEALVLLPAGVERVSVRSDTAGYQRELLRFMAEGRSRFGVIEFAVGADRTAEFRRAVEEVPESEWKELTRAADGTVGEEYAEVVYVPNWAGYSMNAPDYRFVATREPLRQQVLPGMEEQLHQGMPLLRGRAGRVYRFSGVVTNRHELAGDGVIAWYRARAGKGEEVHGVMKTDLAGGRLPSGLFGANAVWWALVVLAFNVMSAAKQLLLDPGWVSRRMKAVRFALLQIPGRLVRHARRLTLRLPAGHPGTAHLFRAQRRLRALRAPPPI